MTHTSWKGLSALLSEVRAGETLLILDRGVPVAQLTPVTTREDESGRLALLERQGALRVASGEASDLVLLPPLALESGANALQTLLEERHSSR